MTTGVWELDPNKFLTRHEAQRLLAVAQEKRLHSDIRDCFVVHLGLSTGLRVMEIAALNCGDLDIDNFVPSLIVRNGKGCKKRRVFFSQSFKEHCKEYLAWKQKIGEPVEPDQPLLLSTKTGRHLTTRALQKAFKRCARKADLSSHFSIHCLRHSHACFLLKASNWNLRLVQKQLGHSSITITQIYADVMLPDIRKAMNNLFF